MSNPERDEKPPQLLKDMLLCRLTGVETAPRTMAEAAMKVKSLANIVEILFGVVKKRRLFSWIERK